MLVRKHVLTDVELIKLDDILSEITINTENKSPDKIAMEILAKFNVIFNPNRGFARGMSCQYPRIFSTSCNHTVRAIGWSDNYPMASSFIFSLIMSVTMGV